MYRGTGVNRDYFVKQLALYLPLFVSAISLSDSLRLIIFTPLIVSRLEANICITTICARNSLVCVIIV